MPSARCMIKNPLTVGGMMVRPTAWCVIVVHCDLVAMYGFNARARISYRTPGVTGARYARVSLPATVSEYHAPLPAWLH